MKTILILGNGHLGNYLAEKLHQEYGHKTILAADKIPAGRVNSALLRKYGTVDVVLNTIAKTDLRWCEDHPEDAMETNCSLTVAIQQLCQVDNKPLIQLSSGCIWEGPFKQDGEPFGPEDDPTPASFYAVTKAEADRRLMQSKTVKIAVLRLRMPYSPVNSHRNLFNKLNSYTDLIDTPNSITSADTLVKTVDKLTNDNSPLWNRITCVYDYAVTSPYRVAVKLFRAGTREGLPGRLEKEALDLFHRPKRVDTVMYDPVFEAAVDPPEVSKELDRVIDLWVKNR